MSATSEKSSAQEQVQPAGRNSEVALAAVARAQGDRAAVVAQLRAEPPI
jgi:hypothetical protein